MGEDSSLILKIKQMVTISENWYKNLGEIPGPGSVEIRGIFDKGSPRTKAFSFGLSREHFRKVYIKENQSIDPCVPGPGSYSIP